MNGFINVLKPPGMSSATVVAFIKRRVHGIKVGHAGTLDPEAAGVLPVMIGKATRLFDYIIDTQKTYLAEIAFGKATDTHDAFGSIVAHKAGVPDIDVVKRVLPGFIGNIKQIPPIYSALKCQGKPLYQYARNRQSVLLEPRMITIHSIDILKKVSPDSFMLRVCCGKGTYIRTLCDEIGKRLDCPAHMRFLLRTSTGVFSIDNALIPEYIDSLFLCNRVHDVLSALDYPLTYLPRVDIKEHLITAIKNNGRIPLASPVNMPGMLQRVYIQNHFIGIANHQNNELVFRIMMFEE